MRKPLAALPILVALAAATARAEAPAAGKPPPRRPPAQAAPPAACKKLPEGKPVLKLSLKPESEVADVIAWYSLVSCTPMLVANNVGLAGKKVTVLAPTPITMAQARALVFAALESVGLTVEPSGEFLRVIESAKARSRAVPVKPPEK
jgi:general secretion pathway protein D